jgi:hypothetical protein
MKIRSTILELLNTDRYTYTCGEANGRFFFFFFAKFNCERAKTGKGNAKIESFYVFLHVRFITCVHSQENVLTNGPVLF